MNPPPLATFQSAYAESGAIPCRDATFSIRNGTLHACPLGAWAISRGLTVKWIETRNSLIFNSDSTYGDAITLLGLTDGQAGSFLSGLKPDRFERRAKDSGDTAWFLAGVEVRRAMFE